MNERQCIYCKRVLPIEKFRMRNKQLQTSQMRMSYCWDCEKVKSRERYRRLYAGTKKGGLHNGPLTDRGRARNKLQRAVRDGKITRQPCSKCGNAYAEAHHPDYSKPLEVVWLCPMHHGEMHRKPVDTPIAEQAGSFQ